MLGQPQELICALTSPGVVLTYPEGHTAGGLSFALGTAAALGTIFPPADSAGWKSRSKRIPSALNYLSTKAGTTDERMSG